MSATKAEYLKPSDIAKRLACAVEMVHDAIHTGQLPAMNISRGTKRPTWRIREADFDAWREARTTKRREPLPPQPKPARYKLPANVKKFY